MENIKLIRDVSMVHNLMKQIVDGGVLLENVKENINPTEGLVIIFINSHEDEPVYQKDIEKVLMVRRSTVTELLNKMERKGLIERQSVAIDKRLKRVVITDKSEQLQKKIYAQLTDMENKVRVGLSEHEVVILHGLLSKVKDSLKIERDKL